MCPGPCSRLNPDGHGSSWLHGLSRAQGHSLHGAEGLLDLSTWLTTRLVTLMSAPGGQYTSLCMCNKDSPLQPGQHMVTDAGGAVVLMWGCLQEEAEGEPGGPAGEGQPGDHARPEEHRRRDGCHGRPEGVRGRGVPPGGGHPHLARAGHHGESKGSGTPAQSLPGHMLPNCAVLCSGGVPWVCMGRPAWSILTQLARDLSEGSPCIHIYAGGPEE